MEDSKQISDYRIRHIIYSSVLFSSFLNITASIVDGVTLHLVSRRPPTAEERATAASTEVQEDSLSHIRDVLSSLEQTCEIQSTGKGSLLIADT